MKTNTLIGVPSHFRKRALAVLVGVLVSQGAFAGPLSVDVTSVQVDSGATYNSTAAVCDANNAPLFVSADVSVGFTTAVPGDKDNATCGNCTKHKTGSTVDYYFETCEYDDTTVTKTGPTVTATDSKSKFSTTLTGGPPTYSGVLSPIQDDGSYGVAVEAVASETVTVTTYEFERRYDAEDKACVGTYTDTQAAVTKSTDTDNNGSDSDSKQSYYVDLAAPTVTHVVTNAGQEVQQLTDLNVNVHITGGSSEQPYQVRAGFNDGSTDFWGPESTEANFNAALNDGIAQTQIQAAAVLVSCDVAPTDPDSPGDEYVSKAQLTYTTDLCGNDYAPPPIDSEAQGNDGAAGVFDVIENPNCADFTNQAVVTAPIPPVYSGMDPPSDSESSYVLVQCVTSQNAGSARKPKVVTYPGTVHLGTVLNSTGNGTCDETVPVGDIVFTLDEDFDFLKTGKSPQAHVFVGTADDSVGWPEGEGPGFWYHTGYPLVEIDPALITISVNTPDNDELTIHLGDYDFGCGAGLLPKGQTLYARAHAKFVGIPIPEEEHTFHTLAADQESEVTIIENPLDDQNEPECVDGQLPPDPI